MKTKEVLITSAILSLSAMISCYSLSNKISISKTNNENNIIETINPENSSKAESKNISYHLNEEWISRDIEIINNVKSMLTSQLVELSKVIEQVHKYNCRTSRDIGFSSQTDAIAIYGGYTTIWISILSYKGKISKLKAIHPVFNKNIDYKLFAIYEKSWAGIMQKTESGYFYEITNKEIEKEQNRDRETELGIANLENMNVSIENAFSLLSDPLTQHHYGFIGYYSAVPPKSREAINVLIEAKHISSLRALLRCANPEGRIYAIEALRKLKKAKIINLTIEDERTINKVVNLKIPILCISGCILSDKYASNIFK